MVEDRIKVASHVIRHHLRQSTQGWKQINTLWGSESLQYCTLNLRFLEEIQVKTSRKKRHNEFPFWWSGVTQNN